MNDGMAKIPKNVADDAGLRSMSKDIFNRDMLLISAALLATVVFPDPEVPTTLIRCII